MTLQQQIRANRLRSLITVFGFVLLLLVLAGLVGLVLDISIGVFALVIAARVRGFRPRALAEHRVARLTHAQEIDHRSRIRPLRRLVENASIGPGCR